MNIDFNTAKKISERDIGYVSKTDVARMMNVSKRTVQRWAKNGRLPEPKRTPNGDIDGWLLEDLRKHFSSHN